jgi:hypothetical protein
LKHRKILLAAATSFLLACAGPLAGANSASAAVSPSTIWITSCPVGVAPVIQNARTGGSNVASVAYTSTSDSLRIENTCGTTVNVQLGIGGSLGAPALVTPAGITLLLNRSDFTQLFFSNGLDNDTSVTLVFGGGGGGGGGGGSSSAPAAAPQTFELSLTPNDGTACSRSSESGSAGTWVNLPAANDCTPPATKPNAKLLGWATSPNFPVETAKRQVDNGWGTYETFNSDGQLTGVFIPAGGSTLVSAAGNLYSIWSD